MSRMIRAFFLSLLCLAILGIGPAAKGQEYPAKPIRVIVGSGAGGSVDLTARMLAGGMSIVFGKPVLVENMPGSNGTVANRYIVQSAPDGYTLLAISDASLPAPLFVKDPGYDYQKGMSAVATYALDRLVLGTWYDAPYANFQEFVAYAKANPGRLNHGTSGEGGLIDLIMLGITQKYGLNIVNVPYKTSAQKASALLAHEIDLQISNQTFFLPLLKAKKGRPLAITGEQRMAVFPDTPTLLELGMPGMNDNSHMILAVANTPAPIIATLYGAISKALKAPDALAQLQKQGMELISLGPEPTQRHVADTIAHYTAIARIAGIQPK